MAIYWRTEPTHRPEIDYDPMGTFDGALPAGIYCEDEETRSALLKGASEIGQSIGLDVSPIFGVSIAGTPVYVATPEQLAVLKAMPAKTPEEARAEWEAGATAAWSKLAEGIPGLSAGLPERRASRPAPPVPAPRHPFHGANRATRRAMAAERRRA